MEICNHKSSKEHVLAYIHALDEFESLPEEPAGTVEFALDGLYYTLFLVSQYDIFCNDVRDPSALDYSKPIFDWLENCEEEALEKWECIIAGESQQEENFLLGKVPPPDFAHFEAVDMQLASVSWSFGLVLGTYTVPRNVLVLLTFIH
ncbi:hypothetical protein NE237_017608 [Protea cynaroides]|uniref:Uncharacterized protein n=1 Tax=Protea cynaroides TaxID=273540 RepID=A0A9Q0QND9_9MAGN|nr:hypothetical protein NE237_017608 [Protea cynaroides]